MTATEAQLVHDYPEDEYHAHPSLSYSTGKEYLRSPAHYLHAVRNRVEKDAYDVGHAAHAKVLGVGAGVIEIPEDVLSKSGTTGTDRARAFIADARAAGKIPLKAATIAEVDAIAEAVLTHPTARRYLEIDGAPEVSLFADDPATGVPIRGRVDWLPHAVKGYRTIPVDLKTTTDASAEKIRRTIGDLHYDVQAAMYRRLIETVRGDETGPMVQIYVETKPPHGVNVIQLAHEEWIEGGTTKLDHILRMHAACVAANEWPAYPAGTHAIQPMPWYLDQAYQYEETA